MTTRHLSRATACSAPGADDIRLRRPRNPPTTNFLPVLFTLLCYAGSASHASAQQILFNVPSTDVPDAGKVYAELDVAAKPTEPRFSLFVSRIGVGGQFGFEQPVTHRLAVQADCYTRKHALGYFTPGALYKVTPQLTGYLGYSLGNQNVTRGKHLLYAEVGFNFN